jgi:hypothetical protein
MMGMWVNARRQERTSVRGWLSANSTAAHFGDVVFGGNLLPILTDFKAELAEPAHVNVRHEHEREERDDVAARSAPLS